MASSFGWLDASERDRRRALDVLDLFQQKETVDELGFGSIRDVIADALSPGTSTIQTRARYFFFIPWIYQRAERTSRDGERIAAIARKLEVSLIAALKESSDPGGTIGVLAGAALKRLPSAVYWAGLYRLGFCLYGGARDQYHRTLERRTRSVQAASPELTSDAPARADWHPAMPSAPSDFPRTAEFQLLREESLFFREQLQLRARDSLLMELVHRGERIEGIAFPWMLPDVRSLPPALQTWLEDARSLSELALGAQLLYNLMLAERRRQSDWIDGYREALKDWAGDVGRDRRRHMSWDRAGFWARIRRANPLLPIAAERFADGWISRCLAARTAQDLIDDDGARQSVAQRERELKGPRARLFSDAQLQLWGGASGTAPLDYRWRVTVTMVNDIVAGLGT